MGRLRHGASKPQLHVSSDVSLPAVPAKVQSRLQASERSVDRQNGAPRPPTADLTRVLNRRSRRCSLTRSRLQSPFPRGIHAHLTTKSPSHPGTPFDSSSQAVNLAHSRLPKVLLFVFLCASIAAILAYPRIGPRLNSILSQLSPSRRPFSKSPTSLRPLTNMTAAASKYRSPPQPPPEFVGTPDSLIADTKRLVTTVPARYPRSPN